MLISWPELSLHCRASWKTPVSTEYTSLYLPVFLTSSVKECNVCKFIRLCDDKTVFSFSNRAEKGRRVCSRNGGWCFQDPSCQRENQQILWEGVKHHTEC